MFPTAKRLFSAAPAGRNVSCLSSSLNLLPFSFAFSHYLALTMRYTKWIGLAAAILLLVSCFMPWIVIESRGITVSGVAGEGTNFGKPGYFHFLLTAFFLICTFTPRIWAKRVNLLIGALNLAWAVKNFFMLTRCYGGECPQRQAGMWLMMAASIIMLVTVLFPDMKVPKKP